MKKVIYLLPLAAGIFWGTTGIFVRYLKAVGMDDITMVFLRVTTGVIMILAYCLLFRPEALKIKKQDLLIIVCGGALGNFGLSYGNVVALNALTMSFATTLLASYPIFVLIISSVFFNEKITKSKILSIIGILIGVILVSGIVEEKDVAISMVGVIAGIVSSICNALYSIFNKKAKEKGYDSITITFYFMLIVVIMSAPISDYAQMMDFFSHDRISHVGFAIIYAASTAIIPYFAYSSSLAYIDAGIASILSSVEPIAAMVFGAVLFHEIPSLLCVVGMLITTASLIFCCMSDYHANRNSCSAGGRRPAG